MTQENKQAELDAMKAEKKARLTTAYSAHEAAVVAAYGQAMYDAFLNQTLDRMKRNEILRFISNQP